MEIIIRDMERDENKSERSLLARISPSPLTPKYLHVSGVGEECGFRHRDPETFGWSRT